MAKSPTQEKLEAQRNQDIRDIVIGAFLKYRGRKNMLMLVALDLDVTDATIYRWCDQLAIDIDECRRPAAESVPAQAEEA